MKILYYSNLAIYLIVIIILVIPSLNDYSYQGLFFLGCLQIFSALGLSAYNSIEKTVINKHMKYYWLLIAGYIISATIAFSYFIDYLVMVMLIVIVPLSIATYFVYITYLIQKR